ncbi:lamin tail domain-containing protein [Candidatus Parcubacteria bacterium]|nr:lamin tail domain-containing protein [Candidatus Parcubacteria bacterium]
MRKAAIIFLCFISLPFAAAGSSSSIVITEIMYDLPGTDPGREWVEVENTGAAAIDFSTWKLFEANINHKIAAVGSAELPAGGFAVIADSPEKYRADNPGFSGLLFDSAFSLGNEGEPIVLRDESGADIDSVSYLPAWGAAGDGNSLQKAASGSWVSAVPTPGSATAAAGNQPEPQPETTGPIADPDTTSTIAPNPVKNPEISTHSSQEEVNVSYEKPQFEITAGRPRIGFVGAPLLFEAKVTKSKGIEPGSGVRSVWSMGDGTEISGLFVSHAYEYPGDYIVVANTDSGGAHAVAKTNVHIVTPKLGISIYQGSVRISNLDRGEMNVGGFIVEDSKRRSILPRDTIIAPLSSIMLSSAEAGFGAPEGFIRIAAPSGKIFSQAPAPGEPVIALPADFDAAAFRSRFEELYKPNR